MSTTVLLRRAGSISDDHVMDADYRFTYIKPKGGSISRSRELIDRRHLLGWRPL